jgi:prepilin-type N-terminal cleavage/methylation domain-containing protein
MAAETGFTLVELLVTMVVLVVVLGATLFILDATSALGRNNIARQNGIQEAESGLARMTKEVREGTLPAGASNFPLTVGDSFDVVEFVNDVQTRIYYNCDVVSPTNSGYHQCVRYASTTLATQPGPATPNTTAQVVIDRVLNGVSNAAPFNTAVFTPNSATSPTMYQITIQVPQKGDRTNANNFAGSVQLNDGIYMRNAPVPTPALNGPYQGGQ